MSLLPLASMKDSMSLRVVEVRNPDLSKVDAYERKHKNRKTVLDHIAARRSG